MLINKRVSAFRDPSRDQAHIRRLFHAINANLKEDMGWRTEGADEWIQRLLGANPPP